MTALQVLVINIACTCLQKALKEKEEHIEQLLREHDLERSEFARAAAQVDEVIHTHFNLEDSFFPHFCPM